MLTLVLQLDEPVRGIVADMGAYIMKGERALFSAMKKLDVSLYEGLKEFEKDANLHVHKEINIFFPMAIKAEEEANIVGTPKNMAGNNHL